MAVYHIPYNQATDPRALFAQGIQNFVSGLIEQNQAKIEGREINQLANALPQDHPLRVALSQGPIRSPALRRGMMVSLGQSLQRQGTQGYGVLPGPWKVASPAQRAGYLDRWGGQTAASKTPLTEPQVAAYEEAMDSRIKRVDKWGSRLNKPFTKDFSEKDLFREWQKFTSMYKFKNDTQREQAWNVWKNKINNLGDEVDWDPTDPKWREEIGLRAEIETSGGAGDLRNRAGSDSVKMQTAPDIALDPYWPTMTPEDKRTAWEHMDADGNVEDIINLLK